MRTTLIRSATALVALSAMMAGCGGSDAGPAAPQQKPAMLAAVVGSFGLTTDATFYTIDTGAGLVFKIRRFDDGASTRSAGDIASMVYNGVQYQDPSRGTQVNSGFDFLYTGVSAVTVTAESIGHDYVKVTVKGGNLTHYYIAKRGDPKIYMGTYFTTEPSTLNLVRFIARIPINALPFSPQPSDLRGTTGTVESGDIFSLPNGETRSKHYSNMRLKDWKYIGATSNTAGVWIVRDNQEGGSGGPFYRSLLNQATSTNQEITYIVNYGEAQTEAYRFNRLNAYTMVFNDGTPPGAVDTSFFGSLDLLGYVGPAGRGAVAGGGISGRNTTHAYTVGFSNAGAQYWTDVDPVDGHFSSTGMLPGDYTMKVYKNELEVDTRSVKVTAGATTPFAPFAIAADPSAAPPLWRIGDFDGSPAEFLNGAKLTTMHPSDPRMSSWLTGDYTIGSSTPAQFPAYQWKSVNGFVTIKFNLRKSQIAPLTLRAGITTAFAGGRPKAQVNGWVSPNPAASAQPNSRTLTVGTYRGNNTMYSFNIPASELVVGENVAYLSVISGSSGTTFLSPGYAVDAVDLIRTP
ncbi:rhamnogalacturonan lyase B N-terminal domain-containing protein [Massilia sp. TWP1-3-3]|uniref:rhamnogalacturonan lyase B N-terminal domain-containing protein n=1 Tax=Massilia sp. TWP1-3-3 TaxID=2804573 RepID=UPI003CF76BDC